MSFWELRLSSPPASATWRGTIATILGRFDFALTWGYLLTSNRGRATLVRLGLTLLLTWLILLPRTHRRASPVPLTASSVAMLATFSYLSHGTAMHGSSALLTDLGHFTAATLWGGAVFYTALSPAWRDPGRLDDLNLVMARVSSVGLFSVLLLAGTGVYASTMHLDAPALLATSTYGRVLSLKLMLVWWP